MNRKTAWQLDYNDHVLINADWCRVVSVARGPQPTDTMQIVVTGQTGEQTITVSGTTALPVYTD